MKLSLLSEGVDWTPILKAAEDACKKSEYTLDDRYDKTLYLDMLRKNGIMAFVPVSTMENLGLIERQASGFHDEDEFGTRNEVVVIRMKPHDVHWSYLPIGMTEITDEISKHRLLPNDIDTKLRALANGTFIELGIK